MHTSHLREDKRLTIDRVAGVVDVWRTDDTHEIIINHRLKPDANAVCQLVLSPRYARHLAQVLIAHAANAEAEVSGIEPNDGFSR